MTLFNDYNMIFLNKLDLQGRSKHVDVMKGLGMLCVVAGHIYSGFTSELIYVFHMPLFFFISGSLFNKKENLKQYFETKAVHFLIPYLSFLLIFHFGLNLPKLVSDSSDGIFQYIYSGIVGGETLHGHTGVFWFVTCLFITQQIANYIMVKCHNVRLLLIVAILLCVSYVNSLFFPNYYLPWSLNVVFAALPIFLIGYLYNKKIRINTLFLLGCLAIIIIIVLKYEGFSYDMKNAQYGIPFATLLGSLLMIFLIKNLAQLISKNQSVILYILVETGRSSMIIMYLHQPIQIITNRFISTDPTFRFLFSTLISYVFYLFFLRFSLTRALFLGNKNDFFKIKSRFSNMSKITGSV